jgi:hypothetical protein
MANNSYCPVIIRPEDKYIAQSFPLYETVLGKVKKNYISVADKQLGYTLPQRGQQVTHSTKNGLVKKVFLGGQDYRYTTQFDKQRFYTIYHRTAFTDRTPCEVKDLGQGTSVFVNTPDGPIPISDLK